MFTWFKKQPNPQTAKAEALYSAIVAQARMPAFYARLGVPDTVDGRFDMILLHAFVVMQRLRDGDGMSRQLSQVLYDVMFKDMERSVREMGIGDLSVPRHIRRMMKAFNGRMDAYEKGLADPATMNDVLRRNVYGTVKDEIPAGALDIMAAYLRDAVRHVQLSHVLFGTVTWPAVDPAVTVQKAA